MRAYISVPVYAESRENRTVYSTYGSLGCQEFILETHEKSNFLSFLVPATLLLEEVKRVRVILPVDAYLKPYLKERMLIGRGVCFLFGFMGLQ